MPTHPKQNPDPVATAAALAATALFRQNAAAMRSNRSTGSSSSASTTTANNVRKRAPQQQQTSEATSAEYNPLNNGHRKGKWTVEEERYADQLIREFEAGTVICKNGTTLRAFLAKRLNCAPMRISKKYAGKSIGKHVFLARVCKGDSDQLKQLEQRFIQSVMRESHAAAVALNHINTTKSQHKAAINAAATFGVLPPYGLPSVPGPYPHLFLNDPMLSAFLQAQRQHTSVTAHLYNNNNNPVLNTAPHNINANNPSQHAKNSAFRTPLPIAPSCPSAPPKQQLPPPMVPIVPAHKQQQQQPKQIDYTKNYHPFAQAKPGSTSYLLDRSDHSADSSVASSYSIHMNVQPNVTVNNNTTPSTAMAMGGNNSIIQSQQQQQHTIERVQSNPMAAGTTVQNCNIINSNHHLDQISNYSSSNNGMEKSPSMSDFLADFDGDFTEFAGNYSLDLNQNRLALGTSPAAPPSSSLSLQWGTNNSLHDGLDMNMLGSDFDPLHQRNNSMSGGGLQHSSLVHLENVLGSDAIAGLTTSTQQSLTVQSDQGVTSADNYAKFAQMSAQAVSRHSAYCSGVAPQAKIYQEIVGRSAPTSPALISVNGNRRTKSMKHKLSSMMSSKESDPKKRYRPTTSHNFGSFPAVSDCTNSSKTSSTGDSENSSDQGGCSDQMSEEDANERKVNCVTESDFAINLVDS